MRFLKTFFWFCVIFSMLTLGPLLLWPSSGEREGFASAQITKPAQSNGKNAPVVAAEVTPKLALGSAADVINMTRLVLETTRDHTANLTNFIERATTVIVVFFTLLGAVAAAFGWHKLRDMEQEAKKALEKFETELTSGQSTFQEKLNAATAQVHREINNQIELITARAEIDQATNGKFDASMSNRMLANACKRIDVVLNDKDVSIKARIRGMADVAFAKKRLGDTEAALASVVEAAKLAGENQPEMYSLLAYNAACYSCLLDKADALVWLAAAIKANPQHKEGAQKDADFKKIEENEQFKALVQ